MSPKSEKSMNANGIPIACFEDSEAKSILLKGTPKRIKKIKIQKMAKNLFLLIEKFINAIMLYYF